MRYLSIILLAAGLTAMAAEPAPAGTPDAPAGQLSTQQPRTPNEKESKEGKGKQEKQKKEKEKKPDYKAMRKIVEDSILNIKPGIDLDEMDLARKREECNRIYSELEARAKSVQQELEKVKTLNASLTNDWKGDSELNRRYHAALKEQRLENWRRNLPARMAYLDAGFDTVSNDTINAWRRDLEDVGINKNSKEFSALFKKMDRTQTAVTTYSQAVKSLNSRYAHNTVRGLLDELDKNIDSWSPSQKSQGMPVFKQLFFYDEDWSNFLTLTRSINAVVAKNKTEMPAEGLTRNDAVTKECAAAIEEVIKATDPEKLQRILAQPYLGKLYEEYMKEIKKNPFVVEGRALEITEELEKYKPKR